MTGSQFLNFLCGTSTQIGLLDKSGNDTAFWNFMLTCLNLTVKDIQSRQIGFHWKFLEKTATAPTVSGQIDYDLPSDIDGRKVFGVLDRTNDITYRYIDFDKFLRKAPDPSNMSGNSYFYTIWSGNLKLFPVPNGVWTFYVYYLKLMSSLADDSNTIEIPAKFDNVVIDGALRYAYKFDPQIGDEAKQIAIYEAGLLNMQKDNSSQIGSLSVLESHRERMEGLIEPFPLEQD